MAKETYVEGPAQYGPHGGPKGAEKLPTKHYPDSAKIGGSGKKTDIEGPTEGCKLYHK